MSLASRITSLLRNLFRRSRVERELDSELRGYLDLLIDEKMRAGASREEATRAALVDVEGLDQVKERVRDVKAGVFLQTLWRDTRYAWRMLVRQPGFSAAAIIALALGIGATTAIFSVVDGVLLRPLPYREPDRLVSIFMRFTPQNADYGWLSEADLIDLRAGARAFEEIGAMTGGRLDLTGTGGTTPEQVATTFVTPSFFSVLGVRPILGRTFLPGEEAPNGQRLLVLGEGLWRRRFRADPNVLGSVVIGNGLPYTIVGVMPADFAYPRRDIECWSNMWLTPAPTRRGPFLIRTVARLKPGTTLAEAEAELRVMAARIEQTDPKTYQHLSMPVLGLRDALVSEAKPALLVMFAAVAFVLLIAIVNVANLLLARSAARGREIAVRLSLGATRGRLVRQLLTESVLLALIGGALGVALAFAGLEAVRATNAGSIPRIYEVRLDLRVLAFTMLIAIGSGLLFGLTPALHSLRASLTRALRDGGDRSATAGASRRRAQGALVIAEIALSLMLLVGAGLLLRSFFLLQHVDTGFTASPAELLTMRLSPNLARFSRPPDNRFDEGAALAYYDQVLARVRQLPGVESATVSETLPPRWSDSVWYDSFVLEGQADDDAMRNPSVLNPSVSPEYLRTLGMPLLRGRWFDARDTTSSPLVTVISEEMARRYFTGRDPIGTRIKMGGPSLPNSPVLQIVGVVGDVAYLGLQADVEPVFYRPLAQSGRLRLYLIVRTPLGAIVLPSIQREIQSFDEDVVINRINTMEQVIADSIAGPRFRMLLIGVFAAVALLLAVTGIYGVMAYSVAQRTHEMGLRLALGAARADVLRLVLGHALRLAALGIALGVGGALLLTRWMSTLLFRIDPTDPLTFASVATALVGVALLASLVPARRATRIDPMVALRHE